ncbi:MAG TPA: helix-turn-helix transcriptional regulator [Stackebrandtia sp.]|uniref:helix-turn-helix transcriptional regulator n=1 Tax=Stackebrandtia sp. TaxID=2023065 RepID=UPI002D25019A|nr:helix-turn-helix transcriptional regulator [Stackebrandtia sp.]HZE41979.1 helix-turn-helix transcriptional regulator [Stackebrandtia sp.]
MPKESVDSHTENTDPDVAAALAQGPFHTALRAAIHARGLGLDRLRHRLLARDLNVSTTSLSYWQHGRTQPEHPKSIEAVAALEEILNLPNGSLRSLLGPRRARGPRSLRVKQRRPEAVIGGGVAMKELCDRLPAAREHNLDVVTEQVTATIDKDGRDAGHTVTMLVRARRNNVDRHIAMFRGDPGCDIESVRVLAHRDCVVGRIARHPQEPMLLAEILFGVTLDQNDTHLMEFEIVDGTGDRAQCYGHGFRYPVEHYTLQVRFDPEQLPRRVFRFAQSRLGTDLHETGSVVINNWMTAQISQSRVEPGALGIGWEW